MEIYDWLRSKQTIRTSSGFEYEIPRFREAADEIDRLKSEAARLEADRDRWNRVADSISASPEIARLKDLGENLAEVLLRCQCECPNYAACECHKRDVLDAWVEATRG